MENENEFDKYPKISMETLLKEGFFHSINLSKNELGNLIIKLTNIKNLSVNVQIGKKTCQKLLNDENEKSKLISRGNIVLTPSGIDLNKLRFYTSEYQNLNEAFLLSSEEEKILKEKIRNILNKRLE